MASSVFITPGDQVINGVLTVSATAVTSTVPGQFTSLGVGVTPPLAGNIQTNGEVRIPSNQYFIWNTRAGMYSTSAGQIAFVDAPTGVIGVGFDFATDGVLGVRNRAQTGNAQLYAASVRGVAVTYANRPATAVQGMLVCFTDSSTAVYNATIAGAGANIVLAMFDGTNWVVK